MAEGSVVGTGVDLVETSRIHEMIDRWGARFKDRIFTRLEQEYCESKAAPYRHYAGRWAVKEAVSKAFGTGISHPISWLDMEVVNRPDSGSPEVNISSTVSGIAQKMGVGKIHVSLSHTRDYAVAQAILTSSGEVGSE